jgi:hypothetical protein
MPNKTPRSEKVQARADKMQAKAVASSKSSETFKGQASRLKQANPENTIGYNKKVLDKLAVKNEKAGTKKTLASYRQGAKAMKLQAKADKLKSKGK